MEIQFEPLIYKYFELTHPKMFLMIQSFNLTVFGITMYF